MARHLICWFLIQLIFVGLIAARSRTVDFAARRAASVESSHVDKKFWAASEKSSILGKSFPIEEWEKHYSPLGSVRAPIAVGESRGKPRFEAETLERKEAKLEFSRWSERFKELHRQAGLSIDDEARIASERTLYFMMLQEAQKYSELGEELSLRDLNRFQFRRNRPEGKPPVQAVGSEK